MNFGFLGSNSLSITLNRYIKVSTTPEKGRLDTKKSEELKPENPNFGKLSIFRVHVFFLGSQNLMGITLKSARYVPPNPEAPFSDWRDVLL